VALSGEFSLAAADFGCTALTVSVTAPLSAPLSADAEGSRGSSKEAADAALSFVAGAARSLHERFARNDEVDEAMHRHFEERAVPCAPELRANELALLRTSLAYDDRRWSRIPKTLDDGAEYFQNVHGNEAAWGKAIGTVDASAVRCLAWLWVFMSNSNKVVFEKDHGTLLKAELEVPGVRSKFMITRGRMPGAVATRVFASWGTWCLEEDGSFTAVFAPHGDYGAGAVTRRVDELLSAQASKSIVGKLRGFYKIQPLATNICRVTLVLQGVLGGNVPDFAMKWAIKYSLSVLNQIQQKCVHGYLRRCAAATRRAAPPP
jgi:hypothetical protein